jgi:ketosteroid isomerase-like protein
MTMVERATPVAASQTEVGKDVKIAAIERFFTAYADQDLDGMGAVLTEDVAWTIPGHHPLSGTKRGLREVLSFFAELGKAGFQADPVFLAANDDHVVDVHRGWTTEGVGKVDTMWALVWHFNPDGRIDRVVNLSGDQHQMDAYMWANVALAPLPDRLA